MRFVLVAVRIEIFLCLHLVPATMFAAGRKLSNIFKFYFIDIELEMFGLRFMLLLD